MKKQSPNPDFFKKIQSRSVYRKEKRLKTGKSQLENFVLMAV